MGARIVAALALTIVAIETGLPSLATAVSSSAIPIYHGTINVRAAGGSGMDHSGTTVLKVPRWRFELSPDTNGIFPDQEPIVVVVGSGSDDVFTLDAGMLRPSRNGKVFSYRASPPFIGRLIRSFRIWRTTKNGAYGLRFMLRGVDLSGLIRKDPICTSITVIVGDDDGFVPVNFNSRPIFSVRHVRVSPGDCTPPWTWLGAG